MNNMKKPKIRFKGFTDDWEQRKLGELGKARSGIGFPDAEQGGKEGVPFYKVSDMNNVGNEHEMVAANNHVTREQIARKGWKPIDEVPAIFFAKVGAAVLLNRKRLCRFPFLLDNNTMAYSIDGSALDADFAITLFDTIDLTSLVQVGALPSYNSGDVEDIDVVIPEMSEQRKIGTYFKRIDSLITLHQSKAESWKNKKSQLSTISWEQRKLEDIVEFLDTLRKPLTENTRTKGPYPYYGASGVVDHVADYLFNEELILLSEDGANITDRNYPVCFLASGKYWVNNHAHVLRAKPKMDNNFICMSLERKDYSNYNTGMAMPKLNQDTCRRIPVDCPSYEEQKKIGDYFRSLDNLITLHHRKLNRTQICIKRSFLYGSF